MLCIKTIIFLSGLPIDIQDSPDDEKLGIDEPAEFPEDVDVIEDPPGDEDSNDVDAGKF